MLPDTDNLKEHLCLPLPGLAAPEHDRTKPVIKCVRECVCPPQSEMAISEYDKIKPPVIPAVKGWFYTSKIDPALLEYDNMKPIVQSVRESICSPQPELVISESTKIKHDSDHLETYMKDEVKQMYSQ